MDEMKINKKCSDTKKMKKDYAKKLHGFLIGSLFLSSILLMSSCGKNKSNTAVTKLPEKPSFADENFVKDVNAIPFKCGEANCPDSVVMLAIKNLKQGFPTICTATFIDSDRAITSGSCLLLVEEAIKNNCGAQILAKTVNGDVFECDEIVSYKIPNSTIGSSTKPYPIEISTDDHAIIKFKVSESSAPSKMIWGDEGLNNHEQATLWSVINLFEGQSTRREFELQVSKCEALQNNYIQPFAVSPRNSTQYLNNCQKNSSAMGSPITNEKDELVGIVYHSALKDELANLESYMENNNKPKSYVLGTNIACLSYFTDGAANVPEECGISDLNEENLNLKRRLILQKLEGLDTYQRQIDKLLRSDDKYFSWSSLLEASDDLGAGGVGQKKVKLLPTCFKNPSEWIEQFRGGFLNLFFPSKTIVRKTWPHWTIKVVLDENYMSKTLLLPNSERSVSYEITFNPKSLKKKGFSDISLFSDNERSKESHYNNITACPAIMSDVPLPKEVVNDSQKDPIPLSIEGGDVIFSE